MLKTRTAFLCVFSFFALVFAVFFYFLINSQLNFLLLKQYEQKIKSLNDMLYLFPLDKASQGELKEFATRTRADFIIDKNGSVMSSLKDYKPYKFLKENEILKISSKKVLLKSFDKGDFSYTLIVYPRFLSLTSFWFYIFSFYLIFCLILFIFCFIFFK